jgi:hypothetical protein
MSKKFKKVSISRGNLIKGLACLLFGHDWQTVKVSDLRLSKCVRCGMKIYYKLSASNLSKG